jgi:hypothetical protein
MSDKKEIYRLWREYLKRSDGYREHCEDRLKTMEVRQDLSLAQLVTLDDHPMAPVYAVFLDVHRVDFDTWWGLREQWLDEREKACASDAIEDYLAVRRYACLKTDLDSGIDILRQMLGREPSATELRAFLLSTLKDKFRAMNQLLLTIDLSQETKHVKAGFKRLMDSDLVKKKITEAKDVRWRYHFSNRKWTGKPRPEELQLYLSTYDLWGKKVQNRDPGDPSGWDKIMQDLEPGRTISNESDRRLYLSYKERAERIIANVEMGFFPGDY